MRGLCGLVRSLLRRRPSDGWVFGHNTYKMTVEGDDSLS